MKWYVKEENHRKNEENLKKSYAECLEVSKKAVPLHRF